MVGSPEIVGAVETTSESWLEKKEDKERNLQHQHILDRVLC